MAERQEALLENVVLPLQLSRYQCSQIFKGIRSSSGNVLLYGPPGISDIVFVSLVPLLTALVCRVGSFKGVGKPFSHKQ